MGNGSDHTAAQLYLRISCVWPRGPARPQDRCVQMPQNAAQRGHAARAIPLMGCPTARSQLNAEEVL